MPGSPVFTKPGVYVVEQLTGPTPAPPSFGPSAAGFLGEHWRGPNTYAVQCNSWSDFVKWFGGFNPTNVPALTNPYLAYSVYMFFVNGGQTCWVSRTTGVATAGASAAITLVDVNATPLGTLKLQTGHLGVAGDIGTWGNEIFVDVVAMPNAPTRFLLNIYVGGSTSPYLVETWSDLSMSKNDYRYAPSVLNASIGGSNFVVATDLNDPNSNNTPVGITGAQLSGGIDCSSPVSSDYITALTSGTCNFDNVPGPLNINVPGNSTAAVVDAAITYAQTRSTTFLVIDPPSGQTVSQVISYLQSLAPVSQYAALYFPWVTAVNPASNNLNTQILLPPGGFVLGQMTAMDQSYGVWRAPAGAGTELVNALKVEQILSPANRGLLNQNNVNAIRTLPNGSLIIYGARTMQSGYATLYVPVRRTLNYIEASLSQLLDNFVFAPNDSVTWANIVAVVTSFLNGLYTQGAFPGNSVASSFYVVCNSTNNTPQTIQQGVLNVLVGLALNLPAEFIQLTIQQIQSTGETTISQS